MPDKEAETAREESAKGSESESDFAGLFGELSDAVHGEFAEARTKSGWNKEEV